jgi:hypothetical protein
VGALLRTAAGVDQAAQRTQRDAILSKATDGKPFNESAEDELLFGEIENL